VELIDAYDAARFGARDRESIDRVDRLLRELESLGGCYDQKRNRS
jgi:hypothetical protein